MSIIESKSMKAINDFQQKDFILEIAGDIELMYRDENQDGIYNNMNYNKDPDSNINS